MKFYISSSDSGAAIKLANAISRVGSNPIISEAESSAPESVISDISSNADEGTVAIVICQNPIKLALLANKSGYFNAVACSTSDDFNTALEEGANLIAVQDESAVISEIASRFASPTAQQPPRAAMQKRQQKPMSPKPDKAQKSSFGLGLPKSQPKPEVNEDGKPLWEKSKGIKKNLRDIFGIE
ncbi:hypothetical protein M1567_00070 [Candidatus Marsarchaeota archaeon]|nr:hypothetical protein [Candidatus Marsarchaeota archaeon]